MRVFGRRARRTGKHFKTFFQHRFTLNIDFCSLLVGIYGGGGWYIMPTFTKIIYLAGKCITVGKYFPRPN